MSALKANKKRLFAFFSGFLSVWVPLDVAPAHSLGVEGSVYPIVERDFLTAIYHRLTEMQASGELERQQKTMVKNTLKTLYRPPAVTGVSDLEKGQKPNRHYFDPTIVLDHDITDEQGRVIAPQGLRINPLDSFHFKETLIFMNADNRDQIQWVNQLTNQYAEEKKRYKIILVKGDIQHTAKALQNRIYFDQQGNLCRRFQIKHTPTLIYQPQEKKGNKAYKKMLWVEEVVLD